MKEGRNRKKEEERNKKKEEGGRKQEKKGKNVMTKNAIDGATY